MYVMSLQVKTERKKALYLYMLAYLKKKSVDGNRKAKEGGHVCVLWHCIFGIKCVFNHMNVPPIQKVK